MPEGLQGHSHDLRDAGRRSLWMAFALVVSFMLVEVGAGLWSNSLSLLADAAHMITDAAAIGLALFAMWIASRPESFNRTFGFHRAEVIAALLNALAMWLIAAGIFFEASGRFSQPPEIQGVPVLVVGALGLAINVVAAWLLKRTSGASVNVEGAFIHVLGDLLGSMGVIVAALLIISFGWWLADPIISIIIGILLLISSGRLLWKVLHVLMQGTPAHIDLDGLCQRLEGVAGVTGVHDIHAWTVTTGYDVFSAHVTANEASGRTREQTLLALRDIASREFGISHVTIQLEDGMAECEEVHHNPHALQSGRNTASKV
ncbi:MAG: cation diffusion facilitator family transporter [Chloroflexi bacterium]|nr:cation diffusion facilitator family transporter [Chloroflexota bacterium]